MSVILNIILAIIALVFFFKFIRLKKLSESEFDNYEERLEEEISKRKEVELKYQSEAHYLGNSANPSKPASKESIASDNQLIMAMQKEIETLHQEKAEELRLRLEAEKQIELALQKTHDAERRIEEWEIIHEENLDIVSNTIEKTTEDLYHKIAGILEEKLKNIGSSGPVFMASKKDETNAKLEEMFKSAGLQSGISYFMNSVIPVETRKSVPCEAFIAFSKENCAIIDNKAAKFFTEFAIEKTKDEQKASEVFKTKIDRYLAYLSNAKYRSNVVNYFAINGHISAKANSSLIMLLNSEDEIEEFKKLGDEYLQILQKNQIHLHSLNSMADLISAPR